MKIKIKNFMRDCIDKPNWESEVLSKAKEKFPDSTIEELSNLIEEMIETHSLKAIIIISDGTSYRLLISRYDLVKFEGVF